MNTYQKEICFRCTGSSGSLHNNRTGVFCPLQRMLGSYCYQSRISQGAVENNSEMEIIKVTEHSGMKEA